ncbi:MAG: hypothetical protein NTY00_00405 [Deltaproteobacteria bacterium]|nr:hypothetical protein [Deltaproteobacteria bacterium]
MLINDSNDLKSTLAAEASSVEPLAEEELLFPVPEPEPELAPVAAVLSEPEREVTIAPEPEPVSEIKLVSEPEVEPEPEIMAELLPTAESAPKIVPEPELDRTPPLADESIPKDIKENEAKAEELESTAMPTRVCAGCGESFHPEFLQEIDAKLYCEVCELRTAVLDTREKSPKIGNGKLRGTIGALLLLGLLALVVLTLKMLGII